MSAVVSGILFMEAIEAVLVVLSKYGVPTHRPLPNQPPYSLALVQQLIAESTRLVRTSDFIRP